MAPRKKATKPPAKQAPAKPAKDAKAKGPKFGSPEWRKKYAKPKAKPKT